jgi:hypothetical protein
MSWNTFQAPGATSSKFFEKLGSKDPSFENNEMLLSWNQNDDGMADILHQYDIEDITHTINGFVTNYETDEKRPATGFILEKEDCWPQLIIVTDERVEIGLNGKKELSKWSEVWQRSISRKVVGGDSIQDEPSPNAICFRHGDGEPWRS